MDSTENLYFLDGRIEPAPPNLRTVIYTLQNADGTKNVFLMDDGGWYEVAEPDTDPRPLRQRYEQTKTLPAEPPRRTGLR